jgi:hypothetical protein
MESRRSDCPELIEETTTVKQLNLQSSKLHRTIQDNADSNHEVNWTIPKFCKSAVELEPFRLLLVQHSEPWIGRKGRVRRVRSVTLILKTARKSANRAILSHLTYSNVPSEFVPPVPIRIIPRRM